MADVMLPPFSVLGPSELAEAAARHVKYPVSSASSLPEMVREF